jgi:hypothetical protein
LLYFSISLAHSPRTITGGKPSIPTTLPFLSQIAEEDLTSASTSVTSFHLPNSVVRRNNNHPTTLPPHRTLSDQDLFTRVNDETNADVGQDLTPTNKPIAYAHFNFDQSTKQQQQQTQQLTKGNSMVSISSESVDVPINNVDTTRRKVHTTTPPPNDSTVELSLALPKNNKVKMRKQTQDIAARAAQRRANLHHKELMEDMGSVFSSEPVVSKENTASAFGLEITGVKPKKTVTINDQPNGLRRTNSDSPELTKHQTTTNGKKENLHAFYLKFLIIIF